MERCSSELMADLSQQVVPGESRVFPAPRPGVGDDLGSASARSLGTSFLRDETGKPVGVVGRLHMVEGGTADPEALDHLGDGESVDPMAAEHLVANLEQIAGIEKGPGAEQFVSDLLGMRSALGRRFTRSGIHMLRSKHRIPGPRRYWRSQGYLTAKEMAAQLKVTAETVERWGKEGKLKTRPYDETGRVVYEPLGEVRPVKWSSLRKAKADRQNPSRALPEVQYAG